MALRDDKEHGHPTPSRWEGEALRPGGEAYGSGRWGSHASHTPSGYSGPSGTGYGETCPGQSGYGQAERDASHSVGGVSYAGTTGYASYASAHHTPASTPSYAQHPRPDWDDIDYQQWRDEQLRKLDADYQTWRQARYRRFVDEFDAWRASRQDNARGGLPPSSPEASTHAPSLLSPNPRQQELS